MGKIICGIQQVGVGIPNVYDAWKWYRKAFGMDTPIFDEAAVAALMLPYTGGEPQERHAVLALNMQGGGGFEIWQYTKRTPSPPKFDIKLGDLGIFAGKIKSHDVKKAYDELVKKGIKPLSEVKENPDGRPHFFVKDPYNNVFEVIESDNWFNKGNKVFTGGAYGAIIGVSDIEKARKLYSDILGFDKVLYDKEGIFHDFKALSGGENEFRRVLLTHSQNRKGAFSQLLGAGEIELVQVKDREPKKMFEDRFWGDLGFIHLCFDINGMDDIRKECEAAGFPFTVDTGNSFDMGEAAGHFSYIEDPDGTLIEFVETHKIPIIKKIGWYLDLKNRNPEKPLPKLMLKALGLGRVKD